MLWKAYRMRFFYILSITLFAFTTVVAGQSNGADELVPFATYSMSDKDMKQDKLSFRQAVFISDDTLVALKCKLGSECKLLSFTDEADHLMPMTETGFLPRTARAEGRLHRLGTASVISSGAIYHSPSLSFQKTLSKSFSIFSSDGSLAARSEGTRWCVIDVLRDDQGCLRAGEGRLLGISSGLSVVAVSGKINFLDQNARLIGTLPNKCETVPASVIIGKDRILLACNPSVLVSTSGVTLRTLQSMVLGYETVEADESGTIMVIATPKRSVTPFKRLFEGAVAIGTLGAGAVDQASNRLDISVRSVQSGKECLALTIRYLENSEMPTADFSPNGRVLLIASGAKLSLYSVPLVCK